MTVRLSHQSNADDPVHAVASALRAQQGQVEYLCEVALPNGVDLPALLASLRKHRTHGFTSEARLALARAAVEVCFEHEESGGLVVPFMRCLGVDEDTCEREWNKHIGPAVRAAIEHWAGSVPDFPHRFVGPVRVHTGVPRLMIPRFARLLYDLACDHGLETVVALPSAVLQRSVMQAFEGTRFAAEFLSSEPGKELVRASAVVLSRSGWPARRDVAGVASTEPGFHAGFLQRLVQELNQLLDGEGRRPIQGVPRSLWPVLTLVEEQGRLAIRFPGLLRSRKCRYTWSQSGAFSVVIKPMMYLRAGVRHERVFSGTIEQGDIEGNWVVSAWPREGSKWAVFDLRGHIVGSHGETDVLSAGEYLLAIDNELLASSQQLKGFEVRTDLGPLDLGGDLLGEFRILHVTLSAGCEALTDTCIGAVSTTPRIEAQSSHAVAGFTPEIDVVVPLGDPYLRVTGWSDERSMHYRVMLEADGAVVDVTSEIRPWDGSHRVRLPNRPHLGIVRIEGRGRRSGSSTSECTVYYAVWPDLKLLRSAPVLGANETGILEIQSSMELEVVNGKGVVTSSKLEICPPLEQVSFVLRIGDQELMATARIPRARLTVSGSPSTPLVLDAAVVTNADRGPSVGRIGDFAISAAPRKGWALVLRTARHTQTLFEVSDSEAEKRATSRVSLRWSQISDAVRASYGPIGILELRQHDRTLSLGTVMVDVVALFAPDPGRLLPDGMPAQLSATLHLLNELQSGNAPPDSHLDSGADFLQNVVDSWVRGARIVHGIETGLEGNCHALATLVRRSHGRLRPTDAMTLLEEWRRLKAEEVLVACGVPKSLWPERWRSLLAAAQSRLQAGSDLTGLLRQLRNAVIVKSPAPPDAPDGLVMGLKNYRSAFSTRAADVRRDAANSALRQFDAASKVAVEPWRDVATTFYLLTMLRLGYVTEFLAHAARVAANGAIPPSVTYIAHTLQGRNSPSVGRECTWCVSDVSPLDDDAVLVAVARPNPDGASSASTWLTLWLQWRDSTNTTHRDGSDILRLARAKMDEIPSTLQDRDRIVSELELGKPGIWE